MARPLFSSGWRLSIRDYKRSLEKGSGPVRISKKEPGHPSLVVLNWKHVTVSASTFDLGRMVYVSRRVMNGFSLTADGFGLCGIFTIIPDAGIVVSSSYVFCVDYTGNQHL